jgi:uncharacterized membrane protein
MPFSFFVKLLLIKIIGQALINGSLFSYIFVLSLSGSTVSALVMFALHRTLKQKISFVGLGIAGAFFSNAAQLFSARYLILGKSAVFLAPLFLLSGVVTGFLLGVFCEKFSEKSFFYKNLFTASYEKITAPLVSHTKKTFSGIFRLLHVLSLSLLITLIPSTVWRSVIFVIFFILAFIKKKVRNPLFTLVTMLFIVFFNTLVPIGKVIFVIGPWSLTGGALVEGLRKAVTVEGLLFMSRCFIDKSLSIPGSFGKLLGDCFFIFSKMTTQRFKISPKTLVEDIDKILTELGKH